ncbi:DUF4352 domain-containing protein [Latilactobacillus curvatus]|uniref:DUF4352 domain-containing protein n=1 Tax=Latilactobacillus curvatus TaxID=28038 RepID=UPI0011BB2548|nr:DUF4352 domain-containing protein [Latilactobacillus curvatus]QEA48384.1 DUF4352 domain-containing protein [Latilactobacillus curvatus]
MAKKITDENGNTYVQKKPFYKRVWFWILVVIVLIIGGSALGGNKDNGGKKIDSSNSSSGKKESSSKLYKIGDTVKVGDVTYTLKSVEKTDERNEFEDKQPSNVLKIVYHVKNEGKEDLPVGADLNVYGPNDNKLTTYALENTMDSVAAGKEMDVTAAYGTDNLGKFELQFAPLVSIKHAAKYEVEVD